MSQLPPPPAPGYAAPPPPGNPFPQAAPKSSTNGLAITSFICGLLGCCVLTPFVGIILGVFGLKSAKTKGGSGRGLAIAGIILSLIWLGIGGIGGGLFGKAYFASKPARAVADAFATDLAAGNVDSAMTHVSADVTRESVTAASAKLQPLGPIQDSTAFSWFGHTSLNGGTGWIFGIVLKQTQPTQYIVDVVDVNGAYKVDGFTFNANGAAVSGGHEPGKK